jgi:galactonate dehydratase
VKITEVKVWLVEGVKYNWTLLKVYTDTGHTGVGEATNWPGSPVIEAAARHVGERVIGLDPLRTDFIWTKLYRDLNWIGPGGASLCAISGLDMALLDLKAKVLGVPMYELLGGVFRTEILLYANYWFTGRGHSPEDYAAQARQVVDLGFTGLKFDPFAHTNYLYGTDLSTNLNLSLEQQQRAIAITSVVREAIGPGVDLMLETHAMLNGQMAIKMAEALAPFGMTWYEEPVGPENVASLRALRKRLSGHVSICVGERHYTRHGFRPVFESHICDIVMPDVTRCGGPSELKRIATMAEAYNVLIAPHNPNGPLSTLASAHVCATIPNFFRCEFMFNDVSWRDDILTHALDIRAGRLHLSERPGLGVDLVEAELDRHPGIRGLHAKTNFYV